MKQKYVHKYKLSDFAYEVREYYQPKPDETIYYIGLEHIEKDSLHLSGIGISSDIQSTKKVFRSGDILFGSLRPYFRKVYMPKFSGICSTDITVIRAKENADQSFVRYLISNKDFIDYATNCSNGTRMPRANWKVISQSKWYLPPLPTQRKIASILSAYDDLIENNNRRIKILEEMAQLIYREWFVKFRFPGHEKVRMVDSELGPIPEGWEVRRLSDLVDTQYGYTESAKELPVGPKYLRGTDINKNSYIDWDKVPFCPITDEDYKKYKLKQGDILVIRMADPGKVGIVEQSVEAVFASYLIRLKIKSLSVTPYYLFYFMLSDRYQNYINGASTGTTRKSASASVITDISLVIPPKEIIDMFEEIIMGYRKFLNILLKQNNILRRTRDLLLPKLISGELDVEDMDIAVGGE